MGQTPVYLFDPINDYVMSELERRCVVHDTRVLRLKGRELTFSELRSIHQREIYESGRER